MRTVRFCILAAGLLIVLSVVCGLAGGQAAKSVYPLMAPLGQYLMPDENSEIALARSAAPISISDHAEVLVLGRDGFKSAVKGRNGWACLVQRSWNAAVDFPEFWNPKIRAPICLNPIAVRSVLPVTIFWTKMVLAGTSKTQMVAEAKAAFDAKKLPALEPGAMSFMMSKHGYLADDNPHFHPHVMFFETLGMGPHWAANLPGSPVFAGEDKVNGMTILPVVVPRWSDGSVDADPAK